MRPDVKLGLAVSMVVVLVAGSYYLYRDKRETAILVAEGLESLAEPVDAGQPVDGARPSRTPTQPVSSRPTRLSGKQVRPPRSTAQAVRPANNEKPKRFQPRKAKPRADRRVEQTAAAPVIAEPKASAAEPDSGAQRTVKRRTPPVPSETVARADRAKKEPSREARKSPSIPARKPVSLSATKPAATPIRIAKSVEAAEREAAVDTHRIQSGDTFSSLAERYYGSTKFTRFLMENNPQITDPNRLRLGTIVKIPSRPKDRAQRTPAVRKSAAAKTVNGPKTYVVKPGDSFYAIARDVLGDATRWKELFELNRQGVRGDPTRLQIGQVLVLPTP